MFLATLASAGARPFIARSPALRMAISASPPPTIAEYPSPALSPWDVVASQISALQAEDSEPTPTESANLAATSPAHTHTHASSSSACRAVAADVRTFRFASPECKRTTGKMKRMSVRCAPCTSPPPSSPPSPPPPPPPSPPPCTRHGEPALLCSHAASRPPRDPLSPPLPGQVRTFSVPHYFSPPTYRDMPTYEPVVGCGRFSVLAWVAHEEEEDQWRRRRCTFRIRVWPSGIASEGLVGDLRVPVASPPLEYHWRLTKQPAVRPAWCVAPPPAPSTRPARPARPARSAWAPEPPALACPGSYEDDPKPNPIPNSNPIPTLTLTATRTTRCRLASLEGRTAAWSKSPPSAVPEVSSCASSGRAWQLWLARRSQGRDRPTERPATASSV